MTEIPGGSERRRHTRSKKRYQVRFGPGDLAHSGYTVDVSESGAYLQTSIIYPPDTHLMIQIEYPEGPVTRRGVVRWAKDPPPAFKRSLRGGMGVEFTDSPAVKSVAGVARQGAAAPPGQPGRTGTPPVATPPPPVRTGPPPAATDRELDAVLSKRRQVSTMGGNTFEVIQTEYRGAHYVRIYQLPLSDGSAEALLRGAFWNPADAEAAVKKFLKEH